MHFFPLVVIYKLKMNTYGDCSPLQMASLVMLINKLLNKNYNNIFNLILYNLVSSRVSLVGSSCFISLGFMFGNFHPNWEHDSV